MKLPTFEPPITFGFGYSEIDLIVVGAGGTGGYVLQHIARLLAHHRWGQSVRCIAIDGDVVEEKNVGRQLFSHAEIGRNKAQTLAHRFNRALGLSLAAIPEMATSAMLTELCQYKTDRVAIVIGCVDTTAARAMIHQSLVGKTLWIDSGNADTSGQVVIGSARHKSDMQGVLGPFCSMLPAPSLLYPDLIKPVPQLQPTDNRNCAIDLIEHVQSMMINSAMAMIVAEYLSTLLTKRGITRYETSIDLESLAMRSKAITATNLARSLDVETEFLTTKGR